MCVFANARDSETQRFSRRAAQPMGIDTKSTSTQGNGGPAGKVVAEETPSLSCSLQQSCCASLRASHNHEKQVAPCVGWLGATARRHKLECTGEKQHTLKSPEASVAHKTHPPSRTAKAARKSSGRHFQGLGGVHSDWHDGAYPFFRAQNPPDVTWFFYSAAIFDDIEQSTAAEEQERVCRV